MSQAPHVVSWEELPPVLTTKQAADCLQISRNTLYVLLQSHGLDGIATRIGSQYRLSREALKRLLEGGASS